MVLVEVLRPSAGGWGSTAWWPGRRRRPRPWHRGRDLQLQHGGRRGVCVATLAEASPCGQPASMSRCSSSSRSPRQRCRMRWLAASPSPSPARRGRRMSHAWEVLGGRAPGASRGPRGGRDGLHAHGHHPGPAAHHVIDTGARGRPGVDPLGHARGRPRLGRPGGAPRGCRPGGGGRGRGGPCSISWRVRWPAHGPRGRAPAGGPGLVAYGVAPGGRLGELPRRGWLVRADRPCDWWPHGRCESRRSRGTRVGYGGTWVASAHHASPRCRWATATATMPLHGVPGPGAGIASPVVGVVSMDSVPGRDQPSRGADPRTSSCPGLARGRMSHPAGAGAAAHYVPWEVLGMARRLTRVYDAPAGPSGVEPRRRPWSVDRCCGRWDRIVYLEAVVGSDDCFD